MKELKFVHPGRYLGYGFLFEQWNTAGVEDDIAEKLLAVTDTSGKPMFREVGLTFSDDSIDRSVKGSAEKLEKVPEVSNKKVDVLDRLKSLKAELDSLGVDYPKKASIKQLEDALAEFKATVKSDTEEEETKEEDTKDEPAAGDVAI